MKRLQIYWWLLIDCGSFILTALKGQSCMMRVYPKRHKLLERKYMTIEYLLSWGFSYVSVAHANCGNAINARSATSFSSFTSFVWLKILLFIIEARQVGEKLENILHAWRENMYVMRYACKIMDISRFFSVIVSANLSCEFISYFSYEKERKAPSFQYSRHMEEIAMFTSLLTPNWWTVFYLQSYLVLHGISALTEIMWKYQMKCRDWFLLYPGITHKSYFSHAERPSKKPRDDICEAVPEVPIFVLKRGRTMFVVCLGCY